MAEKTSGNTGAFDRILKTMGALLPILAFFGIKSYSDLKSTVLNQNTRILNAQQRETSLTQQLREAEQQKREAEDHVNNLSRQLQQARNGQLSAGGSDPPPVSQTPETEIKAVYNEMDREMERTGLDAYFARIAEDCEFANNGSTDGVHVTKSQTKQVWDGILAKLRMTGGTVSIPKVERAIELILPQPDGSVSVKSTSRITMRTTMNGVDEDKTNFEEVVETWRKREGRWVIVRTDKGNM